MTQPVWITPVGSLGVIPEARYYQNTVVALDPGGGGLTYQVIAGRLPGGVQFNSNGTVSGTPIPVAENVESRFTVRATTTVLPVRIADRTFSLTITGSDTPVWTTPAGSIGTYYSGDEVDFQFEWDDDDPGQIVRVSLATGQLPNGLTLTPTGRLYGYLQPAADIAAGTPGYALTGQDTDPYDFDSLTQNKNFEFTLQVSDGITTDLRTFTLFVYTRQNLTADTTLITADNTFITADQINLMAPFLSNAEPSNLGTARVDNYYAYQFIGESYDNEDIVYAISVNQGIGLPPGLVLDSSTGWYYGYIPDQGVTQVDYNFNIVVYLAEYLGTPITCTTTTVDTNVISCTSTSQIKVGQPIVFTGTAFGGIVASASQVYYVSDIVSPTRFKVALSPTAVSDVTLTTASGSMQANLILSSQPYTFALSLTNTVDGDVRWLTDSDLGAIDNGEVSTLQVKAVNDGGRELLYRLKSGSDSSLPQALELQPTGNISGRVSFNGFSLDLGTTTFDQSFENNRNFLLDTTFDSIYRFTVNAYAPSSMMQLYKVRSILVTNGGTGYSELDPPTVTFNSPLGATAETALAGTVTISGGSIVSVELLNPGDGYVSTATITVVDPMGGTGAELTSIMQRSNTVDVISVFKEFSVRVIHRWNKPYQNLILTAMPPENDRTELRDFLNDDNIFIPEYIYRPTDPFFGKARSVNFVHTFGLLPDSLEIYYDALQLNHYWKNLVLGSISTARALDDAGNVLYEVVYSNVIDDLVNNEGVSVGKIVNLPYSIVNPFDPLDSIVQVYPNSLDNMRTQMVDVVGTEATGCDRAAPLPRWMTSVQANGRILGYVPAWVIAYTVPGRSDEIAYYIQNRWDGHLNEIDFTVDRYILDAQMSRNWDPDTQQWVPTPGNMTTFDKFGYDVPLNFLQNVSLATELAYVDINNRTLADINSLGGFDGIVSSVNNNTLIFLRQENYEPPLPGNYPAWNINYAYPDSATVEHNNLYYTALHDMPAGIDIDNLYYWYPGINTDEAWQKYLYPFDMYGFSELPDKYDRAVTVPGGNRIECYQTFAGTDLILCESTRILLPGQEIVFIQDVIGGLVADQVYYVLEIVGFDAFSITATAGGVTPVALTDDTGVMIAQSANQRMGIYTISVDPVTTIVTLSLTVQTDPFDWVRVQRGISNTGAELYYPPVPESGDRRVTWQPLIPDVSAGTIFDGGSLQFVEPVDMYAPGDAYDKYLVWPKQNILGPLPEPENEHIVGWINDDNLPVKWINDDDLITYWTNI
jgi:hypothetical protein